MKSLVLTMFLLCSNSSVCTASSVFVDRSGRVRQSGEACVAVYRVCGHVGQAGVNGKVTGCACRRALEGLKLSND